MGMLNDGKELKERVEFIVSYGKFLFAKLRDFERFSLWNFLTFLNNDSNIGSPFPSQSPIIINLEVDKIPNLIRSLNFQRIHRSRFVPLPLALDPSNQTRFPRLNYRV